MPRFIMWCLAAFTCWALSAFAVASDKSIGKVPEPGPPDSIDVPMENWKGLQFVLLEAPPSHQHFGYMVTSQNCEPDSAEYTLPYSGFAGRTVTVTAVEIGVARSDRVTLRPDSGDCEIVAATYDPGFMALAPARDLDRAKIRWVGKTVWAKTRQLLTYNSAREDYGSVPVAIGDPLKVIDVWWGISGFPGEPLWIIVETESGDKGYISTAYSWTNTLGHLRSWDMALLKAAGERPWEDKFLEFDPKKKWHWAASTWALINQQQVKIGMTKDQVTLSWGEPQKVNRDLYEGAEREQWVYEAGYVYFDESNLVRTIQTR